MTSQTNNSEEQYLLEFLIPTYKRFDGALYASASILSEIIQYNLQSVVLVTVCDDASPEFDATQFASALNQLCNLCNRNIALNISVNSVNKGMSRNIYDMVRSSQARYCTIITDDDLLFKDALPSILATLLRLGKGFSGVFTPRYSYLSSGELYCIECNIARQEKAIVGSPSSTLYHCRNGFILTGFIFNPQHIDYDLWMDHIENAYFPVIYFASLLWKSALLYIPKKWFQHTVLNPCHWESWGADQSEQYLRLYRDYLDSLMITYDFVAAQKLLPLESIKVRLILLFLLCREFASTKYSPCLLWHGLSVKARSRLFAKTAYMLYLTGLVSCYPFIILLRTSKTFFKHFLH